MRFQAEINVMPLKALLDPQGKAVTNTLHNIGYVTVENVRIGKHISLEIEAQDENEAAQKINDVCNKVLINPIMEGFEYEIKEIK
ncbi:MAG: phosphoribosylformylglycinamidine synthase subunit PurS [Bacteroidales bacterium]|nr:phosphoribosylformylglycinamidine synthase subunit PurS [Bacteroidales bacterium]